MKGILGGYSEEDARQNEAIAEALKRGRSPLVDYIDAEIDKRIDRIITTSAPMWEDQNEQGRSFVTLAGGSLVLTVTLVQFMVARTPHFLAGWLLPASWIAFTISVLAGTVRHGWAARVRSAPLQLELVREEIREALHGFDPHSMDLSEEVDKAIKKASDPVVEREREALRWHNASVMVSGWTFITGVVTLVVFAVLNLPW